MNSNKLSIRLAKVGELITKYVPKPVRLADIGSDHAYLPCNLALNNKIEFAIAGEVVEGPLNSAKKEVKQQELTSIIEVRKGNGLEVLQPEDNINVISICGMGGALIKEILENGKNKLQDGIYLILQPNLASYPLRQWLNQNSFHFIDETVIDDHQRQYEIMIVQKREAHPESLSINELKFGKFNFKTPTLAFYKKWENELAVMKKVYSEMIENTGAMHPKAIEMKEEMLQIRRVLENGENII